MISRNRGVTPSPATSGRAAHRAVEQIDGAYTFREPGESYEGDLGRESEPLRLENTVSWDENAEAAETWRGPTRGFNPVVETGT
jgi:hypothetical protein